MANWEWSRRYRVWEANRKEFLYPENWLEPALRSPTAAFGALAAELESSLYHVNLSAVVSKFIGESEKNLDAIFAEAERANAVLLFDEADALFGKRSEAKDCDDRYPNQEAAYLLRRIEGYDGLVLLTTNLQRKLSAISPVRPGPHS